MKFSLISPRCLQWLTWQVPVAELAAIAVELLTQGNPLDEALIDRSVLPQMPGGV